MSVTGFPSASLTSATLRLPAANCCPLVRGATPEETSNEERGNDQRGHQGHRRHVPGSRRVLLVQQAGPGGLLGAVVPALPHALARPGRDRGGAQRHADCRQDRRGREPGDCATVRDPRDANAERLQERRGHLSGRRRPPEAPPARRSQRAPVAEGGRNHASVREEKSFSHKRAETHTEGMGTAQETLPDEETAELTSGYWETYNARMASVGFGDVARRFPGLVGQAVRLGWSASRLDTAAALGLNVVAGVFAGFALFATTGVLEALFAAGPTPERVKAALPSLILVALATAAKSGLSIAAAGRRAGWSRRWTRWSRCASMTWPRRWNSPRSTSRTSTTSCSAPGTGECGRRGSW